MRTQYYCLFPWRWVYPCWLSSKRHKGW